MRVKTSTTKLPVALKDELSSNAGTDDPNHYRIARHNTRVNRKDSRKQERNAKKQNRAQHSTQGWKRRAEEDLELPQSKKQKYNQASQPNTSSSSHSASSAKKAGAVNAVAGPSEPSPKPTAKIAAVVPKPKKVKVEKPAKVIEAPIILSRAEEEEERYIRQLEKQLGYSGSSRKKASAEEDDGLGDLFSWADNFTLSSSRKAPQYSESELSADEDDGSETYSSGEEDEEDEEYNDGDEEEEWGGVASSDDEPTAKILDEEPAPQATTAYVPPHLRKAKLEASSPSEDQLKLTRQLKGSLNRMSEMNISSIIDTVEEMYRKFPRNDVTSALTKLIIEGISSHSTHLDSYVVLHAAFVSSLYKLNGIEFAAHFVQETISTYEKHYSQLSKPLEDTEQPGKDHGKECSNLIILISELYNFQVISCVLVFDIIRSLLEGRLSEMDVELLLKVLRASGQQLRTDDPMALKDIVQIVQDKVAAENSENNSRIRFMVETLLNLKNNKVKKVAAAQSQGGDSMERMKKFLTGLSKTRTVLSHEPIRVSLQDLHSADTKGKWWLVGAAWGGDPLVERKADLEKRMSYQQQALRDESNLLKLARKQGMNSDIRRSIFVVLMSSEDYVDCCERLSQLNLTEVQQREIIRVLLHCAGNEKSYNPYYALIAQHLCSQSHSYKITMQFCLWDFLRDLGETKVGGAEILKNARDDDGEGFNVKSISKTRMRNVAKCYAWWIAKDAVSLLILKPVDFTLLKPQTKEFMRELVTQLLLASQLSTPLLTDDLSNVTLTKNRTSVEEIFLRASRIDTLAMGLAWFLTQEFKARKKGGDEEGEEDVKGIRFVQWGVGIATETLRSGLDIVQAL